jgi:phage N-6-adenine-methyltransferase
VESEHYFFDSVPLFVCVYAGIRPWFSSGASAMSNIESLLDSRVDRAAETAIVEISELQNAMQRGYEQATSMLDILEFRDKAAAMSIFHAAQGAQENAQVAKIYQLKAERKAGAVLDSINNHQQGGDRKSKSTLDFDSEYRNVLMEHKIPDATASRWQLEASLPEERFNEWIDQNVANGWEISAAGLRKVAANKTHVSFNTGESEWYTPAEFIIAAVAVMGRIDLDPASSEIANRIVGATLFHTVADSGLNKFWAGKVWMNPPYSNELITLFVNKYAEHVRNGDISEGIVLVNNATETKWFRGLVDVAKAIVFPTGRIKYLNTQLVPANSPLQGQAILYSGDNPDKFIAEFSKFGWSVRL